ALFYTLGTATGGIAGPWLFGVLIGTGERGSIAIGYAIAAAMMLAAGAAAWRWGLSAERRTLEELARPLSC
ncbi:MAG: MFS transporter, partial [Panacagrimonas sp.]